MHSGATIERVLIAFSRRLMRSANRFILVIAFLTDLLRWQQGRMWHYVFREFDIDPKRGKSNSLASTNRRFVRDIRQCFELALLAALLPLAP